VNAPQVRPGQVWADNDKRAEGRTLRVDAVFGATALCTVLTNSNNVQRTLDTGTARLYGNSDRRGKRVQVAVRRMRPTSSGYRLVSEPEAAGDPSW
jgi:hypothetical protein